MNNEIKEILQFNYNIYESKNNLWLLINQVYETYIQTGNSALRLKLYKLYNRYHFIGGRRTHEFCEGLIEELSQVKNELMGLYTECRNSNIIPQYNNDFMNDNILRYLLVGQIVGFTDCESIKLYKLECTECNKVRYILTSACGITDELVNSIDWEITEEGVAICDSCVDNFVRCFMCGRLINDLNVHYAEDEDGALEPLCEACYNDNTFYCEHCDTQYMYRASDIYRTGDDEQICSNCRDNEYFCCDDCRELYHLDTLVDDERLGYICERCSSRHGYLAVQTLTDETINPTITDEMTTSPYNEMSSYHRYHRSFTKYRTLEDEKNNNKMFIGAELEISDLYNGLSSDEFNGVLSYIKNNYHAVVSSDSSINGRGVELISDPQTLSVWLSRRERVADLFKKLINKGFKSDEGNTSCGLHFHVSRDALGNTDAEISETIARIDLILENLKDELIVFSRRQGKDLERWASFLSDLTSVRLDYSLDLIKQAKWNQNGRRYQALNLENTHTIEFRIFKGSLNIETFYASLELVNNLIELAKNGNIAGKNWNYLINLNNFEDLQSYCKRRNIKSVKALKDATLKLRKEKIKKDKQELKKYIRQYQKISRIMEYLKENHTLLLDIKTKNNLFINDRMTSILNNINRRYRNNHALIENPYAKISEIISRLSDYFEYYHTHETSNGTRYFLYDDDVIKNMISLTSDLKIELEEYKNKGGVVRCA